MDTTGYTGGPIPSLQMQGNLPFCGIIWTIGEMKIAGNPIKMTSIDEETTRMPAPEIGEHNKEIYCQQLGYTQADLVTWQKQEVI